MSLVEICSASFRRWYFHFVTLCNAYFAWTKMRTCARTASNVKVSQNWTLLSYANPNSGGELSIACVVSVLIALYLRWRFLAFDFIMPNHQIVECYIVFTAMEAAKKSEDPDAGAVTQENHTS